MTSREAPHSASQLFPHQEEIGRFVGLLVFGGMTLRTALAAPAAGEPALAWARWALVTGLFALFTAAYLRRPRARALASRTVEIALPLVVAALPFVQGGPPSTAMRALGAFSPAAHHALLSALRPLAGGSETTGLALMAGGEALAVVGMLWLGRSFSLFAEVRELVTAGPYRFVRHPLYVGEIVSVWGYALLWSSPWTLCVAALVSVLQVWRARVEESKLARHLPGYAAYRARTGFLLPRLPGRGV